MRPIDRFARKQPWRSDGIGPTGRKLCCCGCGREVGPRRSSSHSKECVAAWRAHSDLNHIKFQVFQRDKGVCAICRTDTEALKAEWISRPIAFDDLAVAHLSAARQRDHGLFRHWTHIICRRRPDTPKPPEGFPDRDCRWWEADHIVPVVEGGGGCDFGGYRTLCIPCHRAETRALARRRAARRRCERVNKIDEIKVDDSITTT